jgi:pimeloyl-ACP methyl ester carboxylesterase
LNAPVRRAFEVLVAAGCEIAADEGVAGGRVRHSANFAARTQEATRDTAEEYFSEHGLQRPHLVGNSTGGFVALELARRGRATTVCALSPAGFWPTADDSKARAANKVRRIATMCRAAIPVGPLMFKSATVRRLSLRFLNTASHGDRLAAARLIELCQDVAGCTVTNEVFPPTMSRSSPWTPCHAQSLSHGQTKIHSFRSLRTARLRASACPR